MGSSASAWELGGPFGGAESVEGLDKSWDRPGRG
jgi:hypothetical protein